MPCNRTVEIIRIGHRPERDKRITTHVALTARAFGASGIYIDRHDESVEENIAKINRNFGSSFFVKTGTDPRELVKNEKFVKIHLTMYGLALDSVIERIKKETCNSNIRIIVGAEKVPFWIYDSSNYNVSVTSQPISEVSALAIFMD
ncbi:MAG: tRNA (cytidine(56)-2'-O)-methyltransferase, partial [Thermoplasmataceae archaeon]